MAAANICCPNASTAAGHLIAFASTQRRTSNEPDRVGSIPVIEIVFDGRQTQDSTTISRCCSPPTATPHTEEARTNDRARRKPLRKIPRSPDEGHAPRRTVTICASGPCRCFSRATSTRAHLDGDNSKILPTDTMKNTVYSIARSSSATTMEDYAQGARRLSARTATRRSALPRSTIESTLWKRLTVDGKPHPDAFMRGSDEVQTTSVERAQNGPFTSIPASNNLDYSQDRKLRLRRLH